MSVSTVVCGFPSASPPIQLPKRSGAGASGKAATVLGEQPLGRVDQALFEEPVAVANLVHDLRPARPHLVRLPEHRDLPRERVLDVLALVEPGEERGDAEVRRENGAARRLGRMRREDELQRDLARLVDFRERRRQ